MPRKPTKAMIRRQRRDNAKYRVRSKLNPVIPFKYRQLFPLKTVGGGSGNTEEGKIDARFDPWSFTAFYSLNPQNPATAINEPKDYQKNQFDYYRPSYIKIKYTPFSNNSGPQQGTPAENQVPPVYIVFDPDNVGASPPIDSMVTRDYCKQVNMSRPWVVKFRLPRVKQKDNTAKDKGWNNAQSEAGNTSGVIWIKSKEPYRDDKGNVLANGGAGVFVGEMLVTYYCSFKNRQYTSIINARDVNYLADNVPTGLTA